MPVQRSILKTVSSLELSVHDRLMLVDEVAVAVRLLGAFGTPAGVGVGVGVGVAVGVGVGVGVGPPPQPGKLNEPIRVRQLKLVVVE